MELLRRIISDVRQGENIDLYVTVFAAVVVSAISLVGYVPQDVLGPLSLAVLALLAFATLGNRHRLENLLKQRSGLPVFLGKFSDDLAADLEKTRQLWLVGVSLYRFIVRFHAVLDHLIKDGASIRVLLVDPDGSGAVLSATGMYPPFSTERNRDRIREALSILTAFAQQANGPGTLEVRTLDYVPAFGAYMIDPSKSRGKIYLEHYPYAMAVDQIPKMQLSSSDRDWYVHFKTQIKVLWEKGQPWEAKNNQDNG